MLARSIVTWCLLLLATGARPTTDAASGSVLPVILFTVAKSYEPLAWLRGAERFSPDAAIYMHDANGQGALLPDFASSADATVSFDGQRALFAGKRHAEDTWQIWEISLEGGAPRRVTTGSGDCIRPFYLPDDRVVYAGKVAGHFVIQVTDLAGGMPLSLTYTPGNAIPTDILRDGRILFSAEYPLGAGSSPEIYTVYPDGSGVESYRCDHGNPRHSAKQNSAGDLIFVSAQGLGRFTSARAQELRISAPAGEFGGDFAETAVGEWLLSWRADPKQPFQLVDWKQGSNAPRPVLAEQGRSLVQPVVVAPHATPNRFPSGLHNWTTGNLLCLNAYSSKYPFAVGTIHAVRLYARDAQGNPKLLGSAPVEPDGSFFVQVPGDQPLQIELLDADNKTLKRESGFFWMRSGEQRGCVGCHAGPETSPENVVPMILLKSTTPADLTGNNTQRAAGGN